MKNRLLLGPAVLVVGLLVCASSASAALTYFDAQILDIASGKTVIPANTTFADGTPFTALPNGPGGEGPPATTDPAGNWAANNGSGTDNLWNQRVNAAFGNPDASTNGTVYEARGQNGGPNTEDPATLVTTVNVPVGDQGSTVGVYALFWRDSSNWQIAASLEPADDDLMPVFEGGTLAPTGYVFGVYDVGVGDPGNLTPLDLEMNGLTTTDETGNRSLRAAFLGNVTLGTTLSVYVGDGRPLTAEQSASNGGANSRTWYDGIAYGDVQDLEPLPNVPEPASLAMAGLALAAFGLMRRRSG